MKRSVRLGAAALLITLSCLLHGGGTASAADDATLTLTAQAYAVEPDAAWTASFDVVGDLGPAARASAPPTTSAAATTAPTAPTATTTPTSTPARPLVEVRVQAHRAVADRTELQRALGGTVPPVVSRVTVPVALVGTAREATFDLSIPTTNDPDTQGNLALLRPGLYPVGVDLLIDGELVASHLTFVERLPLTEDTDPPMQVALVAAVDDPGPTAEATAVDATRQEIADLAASAAAADGDITVQVPPAVVDGLATPDLASLRTALDGAEVLSVPALALDPSSAAGAGQDDAFTAAVRDGEDLLGAALPDERPSRSSWLAASPISEPAVAMLRDPLGYDLLVLDREVYDGLEGNIGGYHDPTLAVTTLLDDGASLPALVVHPASTWLDPRGAPAAATGPIDRAVAVMAQLRITRSELGAELRRSAVLRLPAGVAPDPAVVAALVDYVATTPGMQLAHLADLATTTDVMALPDGEAETLRLPPTAGIDLAARIERINLTRLGAAGAGSMLLDPDRAAAWDAELERLLSTSIDDATVDTRLAAVQREVNAVYRCIDMPEPFTFTLTGRSQQLRLNLTNTCDDDLRVVVHPTSSKLAFPSGDVARTLAANDVTEVTIDVRSRTNGTSAIGIELLTPVGPIPLPQDLTLTARVNAISGLGQVVTGGALLVLVSWWYGHFRKRRRARRAMLGEVDNPVHVASMSPDAAEATVDPESAGPAGRATDAAAPTDSVPQP